MVAEAVLGFGSNLGARRALIRCALALLEAQPGLTVLARSGLYETPPLGPPQPDYLNAAARVAWCGGIAGLFQITQRVEQLLGRERNERWGARTLDIDLLFWSSGPVRTASLEVPHAELQRRPFALAPLLDVMPELGPAYGADLEALGGPPPLARTGWLDLEADREGAICAELPSTLGDEELASLAVSAVGMCARWPARARASLFFRSAEPPIARDSTFLVPYVEALARQGFSAVDAAIIAVDGHSTRGFLIGEHTGADPQRAHTRVILGSAHGRVRTLQAFPPSKP